MTWSHTPSLPTLLWISLAIPFTIWDSLYMFLRPHTLPGQKWHSPIWSLYGTYASVDHMYNHQAWEEKDGFAVAQCVGSLIECALYAWYGALVWKYGDGRKLWAVGEKEGGKACVVGLVAGSMATGKTMLCGLVLSEVFGDFHHLGHNDLLTVLLVWAPIVCIYFSASLHMIYVFGGDIIRGLTVASGGEKQRKIV